MQIMWQLLVTPKIELFFVDGRIAAPVEIEHFQNCGICVCIYCYGGFLPSTVFPLCLEMETGDFGVEWIIQKKNKLTMLSLHIVRLHHP